MEIVSPCPAAPFMGGHACGDSTQCFEPCGQLGHDPDHVKAVEASPQVIALSSHGKVQIGPLDC